MPQVRNDIGGPVAGSVVQAHTVRDVHVYPETVRTVKPRQLPAPPRWYVGRTTERAMLTATLHEAVDAADTVSIYAITGTGGIGKTSLAMSLAHQQVQLFPDGQLYVDLHGYDPLRVPTPSSVALRGLLDSLGVDHVVIPADLDAQAGLYRSLVAGKRMLIMLDNARDTDQVVPLLPGSATCTVIVTSRDSLSGLIIARGAQQLRLDVLNNAEARGLLAARLGAERLDAEPDAVNALLDCCGGFPLALAVVAGRAAIHPSFSLAVLAAELRDVTTRMGALDDGDSPFGLPAVLSWSYAALDDLSAHVFRLLGLVPGPHTTLAAVASMAYLTTSQADQALRSLERASLIQQHVPDRYRMHDLVRLYAADRLRHGCPSDAHDGALRRLVDYFIHTAATGEKLLQPHRTAIELGQPAAGCEPQRLETVAEAIAWFEAEHPGLLATQQAAVDRRWHSDVWLFAWAMSGFHWRRGRLYDQLAAWQAGLAAAHCLGDRAAEATAHRNLGRACTRLCQHDEAHAHLVLALKLAWEAGEQLDQAHAHRLLAEAWEAQRDDQQALEHAHLALELFQAVIDPTWEADARHLVGLSAARLGRHDEARAFLMEAVALFHQHGYVLGEAATSASLGYLDHRCGDQAGALNHYRHALGLFRNLGHTYHEADTLDHLAEIHIALRDAGDARCAWQQALELYRAQRRNTCAHRVEQRLHSLED